MEMTQQELRAYHNRNIDRFYEWSKDKHYSILVSYPRSGRDWLCRLVQHCVGLPSQDVRELENPAIYRDYAMFRTHSDRPQDAFCLQRDFEANEINIILLIRDPRDAAVSRFYYERKHKPESIDISFDKVIEYTIKEWQYVIEMYSAIACCVIRYEDLCLCPVQQLNKVLYHLDVPFSGDDKNIFTVEDAILLEDRKAHGIPLLDCGERYHLYCQKHQNDDLYQEIPELSDLMEKFGYTIRGDDHEYEKHDAILSAYIRELQKR